MSTLNVYACQRLSHSVYVNKHKPNHLCYLGESVSGRVEIASARQETRAQVTGALVYQFGGLCYYAI